MKISIIVPIYNAEKHLEKCLKSLVTQTYKNIEIILVNDGSTDSSLKICSKFKANDGRIIIINKKNEGSIKTRKAGVELATGEYIMFCDADDFYVRNAVELLAKNAIKYDVVVGNSTKFLDRMTLIRGKKENLYLKKDRELKGNDEIINEIIISYLHGHSFPASLCGKLYKKELIQGKGNMTKKIAFLGEDLYLNMEIFLESKNVKLISENIYFYRLGGNTSRYMSYLFSDAIEGYKIQKEVIKRYFKDSSVERYRGISIMLINYLNTAVNNCFMNEKFSEIQIKEKIREYLNDLNIIEASMNEGVKKYFSKEHVDNISNKNIDYFYELGRENKRKSFLKGKIKEYLSK